MRCSIPGSRMIDDAHAVTATALPRWRPPIRRLRLPLAMWAGGAMLVAILFAATFAPLLTRYDPLKIDLGNSLQPPSAAHPLGTDNFGRDILGARALGASDLRVIRRHLWPNVVTVGVIFAMSDAVLNILLGGALSFLGLGVQPPTPEWGLMIAEGRDFLLTSPAMVMFPGLALLWVGVTLNVLGDTLTDRFRPGG